MEASPRRGHRQRWTLALGRAALAALWCSSVACGDSSGSKPAIAPAEELCERDDDCSSAETCVEGECVRARCTQGADQCSSDGRAVIRCTADGAEETLQPCRPQERCKVADGSPVTCMEGTCAPKAWSCDGQSRYAELCDEDGVGYIDRVDCADSGLTCRDGECVEAKDGDEGVPTLCEPGTTNCDSNVVMECARDGSEFVATIDCAEQSDACFAGECWPRVCEHPFECRNNESLQCVDNGTRLEADPCGAETGSFCNPSSGQCQLYVCLPGIAICDGYLATRCQDDGSGPATSGLDCAAEQKTCWDGGCAPRVCEAGFQCIGRELMRCGKAGSEWQHFTDCEPGTVCDATVGRCAPAPCAPDAAVCRGAVATRCDSSGLGYVPGGTDCAADQKTCLNGACAPRLCTPGAYLCAGKELKRCDGIGSTSATVDTCSGSEYCNAEQEACVPNICTPGSALCSGTVLTSCNAEGTGPEPGGIDCAEQSQVCVLGECQTQICSPSLTVCQGEHVFLCNDTGTVSAPFTLCTDGKHCAGSAGAAACVTAP